MIHQSIPAAATRRHGCTTTTATHRLSRTSRQVLRSSNTVSQLRRRSMRASCGQCCRHTYEGWRIPLGASEHSAAITKGYVRVYNHHIPRKALSHIPSIQAMKNWYKKQPNLFTTSPTSAVPCGGPGTGAAAGSICATIRRGWGMKWTKPGSDPGIGNQTPQGED